MSKLTPEKLGLAISTEGFRKAQADIAETTKNISDYQDQLKKLQYDQARMRSANKEGTTAYRKKTAEITKVKREIKSLTSTLKEQENQLGLTGMSYNQLKKKAGELTKELYNMSRAANPEEWKKKSEELKQYQHQMAKMQQGIKMVNASFKAPKSSTWSNLKQLIPIASIVGIGNQLRSTAERAIETYTRLDDKMADVQKTTGMSKEEVKALDAELMKIDTRTSREDLLDLARVAGKLGVAKEEVAGFVRATDQIRVALSEDLGDNIEESIQMVGKLTSIFHLREEMGLERSLLAVGSAINSLGAASEANESYLVDFTNRTAGVAPQAKVSIQNVLGLGATLDQLGQTAEVAGTTYTQVITGMFKRTDAYAKVAGMSISEFSKLLKEDANEAFIRFLEGANNGGDMEAMTKSLASLKLEGTRSTQVIGALAGNIDMLREQQALANAEFAKATSLTEEYNTKNESAQAEIEKRRKAIDQIIAALGEKLMPLWSNILGLTASGLDILQALIGTLIEYRGVIISVVAVGSAYIGIQKLRNFYSKANRLAILEEVAAIKAGTVATTQATTGAYALSAAKALVTLQFRAAAIAAKAFFTSIGPIGWIAMAIGAAVGAMAAFSGATKKASEASSQLALELSQERATHDDLKRAVTESAQGSQTRAEAIRLINERYKEYLPYLVLEKMSNEEIAAALDYASQKMEENIKMRIRAQEAEKLQKEMLDAERGALDKLMEAYLSLGDKTKEQVALAQQQLGALVVQLEKTGDRAAFVAGAARVFGMSVEEMNSVISTTVQSTAGTFTQTSRKYGFLVDKVEAAFDKVTEAARKTREELRQMDALIGNTSVSNNPYETLTIDQLSAALSTVNSKLSMKNALTAEQRVAAEAERKEIQEQLRVQKLQAQADNTYIGVLNRLKKEKQELEAQLNSTDGANKKEIARIQALIATKQKEIDLYENKKSFGSSGPKWSLSSDEEYLKAKAKLRQQMIDGEIQSEAEFNQKVLELEIQTLENRIAAQQEKGTDLAKLEEQLLDKRYQQQKAARDRENKLLEIAAQGDSAEDKENDAYEKQLRDLGLFGRELEEMTVNEQAAYLQLKRSHYEKLSSIYVDELAKEIDNQQKAIQRKATAIKQAHADELATATTFEQKKALIAQWASDSELRRIQTDKQADQALQRHYAAIEQAAMKEDLENMLSIYQAVMNEVGETGLFSNGIAATEEDVAKLQEIIDNLKQQLAELGATPQPTMGGDTKESKANNVDILGMTADQWSELQDNLKEGKFGMEEMLAIAKAIGSAFSEVSNLMSAMEQRELKEYEKTQNKKKQLLERQLKAGTISQEQYNDSIQRIDEQTDAKREEIERKQAKRDKALAVFNSLINTAVAITAALTAGAAGPILAAIVGALGAVQTAAILATPLPGAESGGLIGVEREQDGKHFTAEFSPRKRGFISRPTVITTQTGKPVITGEAGTEYVVPNNLLQNPEVARMVDLIEAARLSGSFRIPNFSRPIVSGYATGGYLPGNSVSSMRDINTEISPYPHDNNEIVLRELRDAVGKLSKQLDSPIPVYNSIYGRDGVETIKAKLKKQQLRAGIGGK